MRLILAAVALTWSVSGNAATAKCDNLRIIEPTAAYGRLSVDQTACLESAFARASRTARIDISRVLITNASSRHDMVEWERLVARHLGQVDDADADLAYRYAHHLAKDPTREDEYLAASAVALEHGKVWMGTMYAPRLNEMMAGRARIGQARWMAGGSEADRWRKFTRTAARDWYVHVMNSLGPDDERAESFDLCIAAGGTVEYCERGT